MSETGTARIMRLSVDPAGVGWVSGDGLAGLRWLADGDVCRGSRVGCAYMVPGLYMPCRMGIPEHFEVNRHRSL